MGECLRTACPCLDALRQRIFGDKNASTDGGDVGGGGGGGGSSLDWRAPGQKERPVESSSVFTALWSFDSRQEDELSFTEGDLFSVINRNGTWWSARRIDRNGRVLDTGVVPSNYLARAETLEMQPWYFGTMNRFQAQSHLLGPGNDDRAFLVRHSEKDNVGYVLSVRSSERVKHFKVLQDHENNYHVEQSQHFSSMMDLVEFYCTNSLNNTPPMGNPCKKIPPNIPVCDKDEWELPKSEFTVEAELGSGYFATVHRGRWKNMIKVAIKILRNDSELNHAEFQREVEILKRLRHRHLISLFAICTASTPFWIITELMEKGNLLGFLRGPEGQNQDFASLIDMGAQVADGMSYLEEKESIHRDLAARNVLVGEDYICKVADFGLARVIKEPFYITDDKKIPYKWTAPEAITHGKFSNKSDVWSFGILLYEIATYGGVPYPAMNNQETHERVTKGYRMPAPDNCPNFLYNIMLKCWSAQPEDRPDFKTLKSQLDNSSYDLE
ncbi:protein-tyrosine kinase 6b [Antennarius striatus]|uniref:protein-tyrosine kinase 6b n=1 Tax=Antennarius striatus TaxID=241820 RepID=UPI0035B18B8D